ncbi:MAG: hypothetical protein R2877_08655 [Bdellovibrionota bacterium]
MGSRLDYSVDFGNKYHFLSILGELVYRFGTRVPDTLISTFSNSTKLNGYVFIDANDDGAYQIGEKLIENIKVSLNGQTSKLFPNGHFTINSNAGPASVMIDLPDEYKSYLFGTANPIEIDLFAGETKPYISQLHKNCTSRSVIVQSATKVNKGLEGTELRLQGLPIKKRPYNELRRFFSVYVPEGGKYSIKLMELELPAGYKNISPSAYDIQVVQGKVNQVDDFVLLGKRLIIGRAFVDVNQNNAFDDGDIPAPNIKIQIGKHVLVTDVDGSFSTSSIEPGTYDIHVGTKIFRNAKLDPLKDRLYVPEVGTIELIITYTK